MWSFMGSYTGTWSPMASIIAALCYTRCSQMTGDVVMRRKGLEMYQNALMAKQVALGRRRTAFEPETVLAIGIMSIYEVGSSSSSSAEKSRACELVFTNVGHGGRNWQQRKDALIGFRQLNKDSRNNIVWQ
ncbi:MAG: hypothetical protein CL912_28180 [Deltaproteobacteria bacterium]|nr:hypothetical protein [Deltaproteobacteria bacterium]